MSHFDNKSIPALGDGAATTVTTQTADWRSHSKRSVPVMREAIA